MWGGGSVEWGSLTSIGETRATDGVRVESKYGQVLPTRDSSVHHYC